MNLALIIIIVIAVILAIFGGLNSALSWLLWVAIIVGVIALIVFLFRVISGNRTAIKLARRPAEGPPRSPPGSTDAAAILAAASDRVRAVFPRMTALTPQLDARRSQTRSSRPGSTAPGRARRALGAIERDGSGRSRRAPNGS